MNVPRGTNNMNDEQFNQFTLESFITRREAMKAANAARARNNDPLAYEEDSFAILEREIIEFRNSR